MNRRDTLLASLALGVLPGLAGAQPVQKVFRIGVLSRGRPREQALYIFSALRALGYEEGKNVVFDYRNAEGREDRLAVLAAELVASKVDLIIAPIYEEILAAKRATSTIPIVMLWAAAPVEFGLVASLAHPGGNVTGTTFNDPEWVGKILEVLRDTVPRLSRVAVLYAAGGLLMDTYVRITREAAVAMGIHLTLLPCSSDADFEAALAQIARERPEALYVATTGVVYTQRARVIAFAARQRLPAIYLTKELVTEGGLIAYTPDAAAVMQRAASIIDRILKGAKPADIPVEQPTRFELVINMKTARALGIRIPQMMMLRATELIE